MFLILLVILIFTFLGYYIFQLNKYKVIDEYPGPSTWELIKFMILPKTTADSYNFFISQSKKHGPIVKIWLKPFRPTLLIRDHNFFKSILFSREHVHKASLFKLLSQFFGDGLPMMSDIDLWRQERKTFSHVFTNKFIVEYTSTFKRHVIKLSETIKRNLNQPIDLQRLLLRHGLNIIYELLLTEDISEQDNRVKRYMSAMKTFFHVHFDRVNSPLKMNDGIFKLTQNFKIWTKCCEESKDFIGTTLKRVTDSKRKVKNSNEELEEQKDFLDLLLETDMSYERILENMQTFIAAGSDTVSVTVGFTLYEIAKKPEIQEKIYQEYISILGPDENAFAEFNDIQQMSFTECVIKETLRMHPPVPMIFRSLLSPAEINGKTFPADIDIILSLIGSHQTNFEDPFEYKPERFLPENIDKFPKSAYAPFSLGPRDCIGKLIGIVESKFLVSYIIRHFTIHPVLNHNMDLVGEIVLTSKNGLPVIFKKRDNSFVRWVKTCTPKMEGEREHEGYRRGYYSEAITNLNATLKGTLQGGAFKKTKLLWQVRTEHHAPIIRSLRPPKKRNFLAPAERWMCYEEEKSICFPVDTFEPKVQMQHEIIPFVLPRNVAIERRRRQYQERTIRECLANLNVNSRKLIPYHVLWNLESDEEKYGLYPKVNYLPLELFDDEEYDARTPDGWLNHGLLDGVRHPLPGEAFIPEDIDETKLSMMNMTEKDRLLMYTWTNVAVLDYIWEKKLWSVLTLDGLQRPFQIPRIYLMFKAEDPEIFALRIKSAIDLRDYTESVIRYEFYLDCITLTGTYDIDDATWDKMFKLATRGKKIFKSDMVLEIEEQVRLNHRRALGEMEFRDRAYKQPYVYNFLTIPKREEVKVPQQGFVDTGMKNFKKRRDYFRWMNIYVVEHTHRAMCLVVGECMKVAQMCLFTTSYGKNVNLAEFTEVQTQTTNNLIKHLKTSWLDTTAFNIRMCLGYLGKGWFNLNEKQHEIYDTAKLIRFMGLVKFHMQYALRLLVKHSVNIFTQLVESPCKPCLSCEDDYEWGSDLINSPFRPSVPTIFSLILGMNDSGPFYNTDPNLFDKTLLKLYDTAISLTHTIKQVHPQLLTFLRFPKDLTLSSVGLLEDFVCKCRDTFMFGYQKAIIPVKAYAKKFEPYLEFWTMDIPSYIEQFKEAGAPEVKEEVSFQLKMKSNIEMTLPPTIIIGPFLINATALRDYLINKRQEIATKLLNQFARRMKDLIENLIEEYHNVQIKLMEKPNSIEHIYEIRDWMETIPMTIRGMEEQAKRLLIEYDILDGFWYNLPDEDFENKWDVIAWPRRIALQIEQTNDFLIEETEKFLKIQFNDEMALTEKIDQLTVQVTKLSALRNFEQTHDIAVEMRRIWKQMKEAQEQGQLLNQRQKLFNMPVVPFDNLTKLMKEFQPYKDLWITASDWLRNKEIWMDNPLVNIDSDVIERITGDMQKMMIKLARTFQDIPAVQEVAITIRDQIEDFKPLVPLIQSLRNPGMRQRHWDEFAAATGIQINITPATTFHDCLELGILPHADLIVKTADTASKEYGIEHVLEKMVSEWENANLELTPYKKTGTFIVKVSEEIQQMLDDHLVLTQQISFSPFKAAFEERIDQWEQGLRIMSDVFEEWMDVQRQWMYLEPIFASEDIKTQLPNESKKYGSMERSWKRIMRNAYDCPKIIDFCPDKKLLESLRDANHMLEIVQKGLAEYLEHKRSTFPRLFFLSDDELLEILSQARNPLAVQPHLKKCFENISRLTFEEDLHITQMFSAEEECVDLRPTLYPTGNVECWLSVLEENMRSTLRLTFGDSYEDLYQKSRQEWVLRWPGQIVIACSQTYWTAEVENGLRKNSLPEFFEVMLKNLDALRSLVKGSLTFVQREVLCALIVIEVHSRDVTQTLVDNHVMNVNDFDWISQLRYYWIENEVKVRAVNAEFPYGYEYLGNSGRLVITPLTDRCYLTLTGALHLKFGGAPAGPAGTGKTETTKDLAKAFARQCVVFNCSDQLDFMAMGKFFKGLASSGAWACFDEFNRIDIEVLSVVAQQIMTIQKAQQARLDRFFFEGSEIVLKESCAVFITMNPGYAGRTELPDNLKALFRPVAMMVPNYSLIAEISLFSFGFGNAKQLANKITTTFKLSSEQLSSQDHYDFGMRAVKTVIAVAGNLKREKPNMNENQIILRSLRDVNVPKFLKDDLKLFNGIVSDLFPRMIEEVVDYGALESAIRSCTKAKGLEDVDEFVRKVIQLYETTVVRHGLMLVGPTGSGKTKCYVILQDAMTKLKGKPQPSGYPFQAVHTYVMNPKSITMGQLYGEFDLQTHEWTDGILPSLVRVGINAENKDKRWYVFDGPVDAVWIENMNTVLDDNKKLCLSSGEIIKLRDTMTMMFEVADLAVASPATVSRCGMVYLEPGVLGLEPFINCWILRLPQMAVEYAEKFRDLFNIYLYPALDLLRSSLKEILTSVDSALVLSFLNLMDFRLSPLTGKDNRPPPAAQFLKLIPQLLIPWVVFSLIWTIGCTCDHNGRDKFSEWLRKTMAERNHYPQFPNKGLVYDYRLHDGGFTIPTDDGDPAPPKWQSWMDNVEEIKITVDTKYSDMEVPTIHNIRNSELLGMILMNENNVLCVGPTGTGKTLTVIGKLSKNMHKKFICDFITFSARTSANQTQDLIDSKLDRRRRGVFGPPVLKRQVFFIDDFNMPALEVYGAQPPIELIRQWMDFGGWYDRKNIGDFRTIIDVNFVAAMGPPGGGRNPVTARLLRHFHYLAFTELEEESKQKIFGTILNFWINRTPEQQYFGSVLLKATLNVYTTILYELLPTPAKTHYTFNLRDLSKVFQGILMMEPETVQDLDHIIRLWYHENCRVYQDRLINDKDRGWFANLLKRKIEVDFKRMPEEALGSESILFGDFLDPNSDIRNYVEITDMQKLSNVLDQYLFDYNNQTTRPMKLVLFLDAIAHVCRIARIIRQPMGNGLLLGMGGSGRQSLTRLSAHMAEFYCFQIELTSAYSGTDWKEDIKGLMLQAGLYNRESVFLFSDTQIKSESFLEDLNSILNSGDVPNIYQPDELDKIFQGMKGAVQELGLTATKSNLFSVYQKSVRANLHTVISMSPIGELFRARLRQFPALVNCCTIDWFSAWPDAALQSVALQFLEEIPDLNVSPSVFQGIVVMCQFMHASVVDASSLYLQELSRHNYVTPTLYLQLLSSYTDLMNKKKGELSEGVNRLKTGLGKLQSTAAEVKILQQDLELMKPALEIAAKEAEEMIVQIAADTEIAEETKQMVEKEEAEATKKQVDTQNIAEDAQRDLEAALPALEAAEKSLQSLNKGDISEVRTMKRPPQGVIYVIESICIVKGIKPKMVAGTRPGEKIADYWEPGRNMLSDPGLFLTSLINFDRDTITEDMINKLQKYVNDPSYQPEKIAKVSKACTSLCMWVHAMYKYYFVNLTVAPKKAALAQAKADLAITEKKLAESQARMRAVQKRLDGLNKKLQARIDFKEEKQKSITLCEERLNRAQRLIAGLAGERVRWIETINTIESNMVNVTGNILLSSGAVAYLTNFTDKYRRGLLSEWYKVMSEHKIPHTPNSNPVNILGEPVQIRQWQLEGLPRDYLSTENAVLVSCSRRWPLFIDPQGQANKWVKNMCKPKGLSICKQADKDLLRTLESAIRFGKPVLIENVGQELDPALDPILNRSVFKQGGQMMIKIGDAVIPYNDDFQLFITTKWANPHYSPEVSIKVLLVNFTLVPSGLEDQLLGIVVMQERPDLEELRSTIVVSIAQMKQELKEIQDRILYKLSASEGSPLDDIEFIVMLEASKVKSEDIKVKVEAAEITQIDIDNTRALYVPVAVRGQILFFCLADLANVDPMYQYSLEWFVSIFIGSMVNTEKSDNLDERVFIINEYFTFSLYSNVCRSLFEKHKLHFAFLMCIRILMNLKVIDPHEWHHFLAGGQPALDLPNPCQEWLSPKAWNEILALGSVHSFKEFVTTFGDNKIHYKRIFDSLEPHREALPNPFEKTYHDFQKMVVLKSLRPDKVTNAMQDFLTKFLGARFVEPISSDLMEMFKESGPIIPLIFVLSTGTDPAAELFKFADRMRMSKRMLTISLGQGQGPRAELMIKESVEIGSWVFFQNCHLAPSWMPRLERIIETIQPESVHKDFRIWLTSTPSPFFPVSILQNGCKMTVEPPRGIKANMLRAYQSQVTDFLDFIASTNPKVPAFKYLLFSLCLFHAILLERRKFGPLGFNIPYEFTDGDLKICISQLHMFLLEYDEIPFKVLLYTAGQINYGGRVTDDWDRRCLMNILFDYYKIDVVRDGYIFDPHKNYYQLNSDTPYIDYLDYIKTFPLNDDPEAFGMHPNADISCAQSLTYACLATLLMLQPKQVGGAAASQEEDIAQNANAILKFIPKEFNLGLISERYPVLYEESLNTVIIQEAIRYNKLLKVIVTSLNDLLKALKGLVVMSEALEKMSNSLFSNSVPAMWSSKAYPSLKPLAAWVTDLQARCRFLDKWVESGIPPAFWISGFYFPQAFLTGTLQNYARKCIVSIDTINFGFQVLSSEPTERPADGCIIYGLYLEGSKWNPELMRLDESNPKELYTDMPHIWLLPEENHQKPDGTYECPTYKTLTRAGTLSTTGHSTNYVLAIEVPSVQPQSHWIKRGVALICALDY